LKRRAKKTGAPKGTILVRTLQRSLFRLPAKPERNSSLPDQPLTSSSSYRDPFADVSWAILELDAARFAALKKADCPYRKLYPDANAFEISYIQAFKNIELRPG
jgi:hypothetical protein